MRSVPRKQRSFSLVPRTQRSALSAFTRVFDALWHLRSGALQSRGPAFFSRNRGPGSAKRHFAPHRAREMSARFSNSNFKQPHDYVPAPPRGLGFWLISLFEGRRNAERRTLVTAAAYFPDCRETEAHGNASQRPAAATSSALGPFFRHRREPKLAIQAGFRPPFTCPVQPLKAEPRSGPGRLPKAPRCHVCETQPQAPHPTGLGYPAPAKLSLCPTSERLMKRPSLDRTQSG
jgi:hypothetical protein